MKISRQNGDPSMIFSNLRIGATALVALIVAGPSLAAEPPQPANAASGFRVRFLEFCNLAVGELKKEMSPFRPKERQYADPTTHHMPSFEDAHAVQALAVAYDLTGNRLYLDTCKLWSDRMIAYQQGMIPRGGYYMNHSRAPGEDRGEWTVADSGSIGMAVLATAVRCQDPAEKAHYLDSTRALAKLVMENYVGPDGGIANGCWSDYHKPWWCSTATFGSLAFLLYNETRDEKYLKVAQGALDWMTRQDFRRVGPITFQQVPASVLYYTFEFYATALPYLRPATPQYDATLAQITLALDWMAKNQKTRAAGVPDYLDRHAHRSGLPALMYVFARHWPQFRQLEPAADGELRYIAELLHRPGSPNLSILYDWEVLSWGMLSYAEKVCPGALRRRSR
jgi:hypothetical protein